jgi:hypothetical protein
MVTTEDLVWLESVLQGLCRAACVDDAFAPALAADERFARALQAATETLLACARHNSTSDDTRTVVRGLAKRCHMVAWSVR